MCRRTEEEFGPKCTVWLPCHRHFVWFFNHAPKQGQPFNGCSEKPPNFSRLLRRVFGYGGPIFVLRKLVSSNNVSWCRWSWQIQFYIMVVSKCNAWPMEVYICVFAILQTTIPQCLCHNINTSISTCICFTLCVPLYKDHIPWSWTCIQVFFKHTWHALLFCNMPLWICNFINFSTGMEIRVEL